MTVTVQLSFATAAEAAAALSKLAGAPTEFPTIETPPPKATKTAVKAAPAPASAPPSAAVEPAPAPAVAAPAPTADAAPPTEEEVSAAVLRFVPNPAHKERAVALLKTFGVARGRELKPEQRAPFLAQLAEIAKELGL